MDANQKEAIFKQIQSFKELDLDKLLGDVFPAKEDWDEKKIKYWSITELRALLPYVFETFELRLRQSDYHILPFHNKVEEIDTADSVSNTLARIITYLNSGNCELVENEVRSLIQYATKFDFWQKDKVKMHPIAEKDIKILQNRLSILQEQIESLNKEQKEKIDVLNRYQANWTSFSQKQEVVASRIETLKVNSESHLKEIENFREEAIRKDEQMKNYVSQHEEHVGKIKETLRNWSEHLQKLGEKGEKLINEIEGSEEKPGLLPRMKANLSQSSAELEFFSDTHEYLDQLLASAVGASLFETFARRKEQLENPVKTWTWITLGMVVLAVVWVYLVFGNIWIFGDGPEGWIGFALDSIKIIPILFLVGFSVDRFRRERKYQEEYAFKSAVALTIKGYVDLIETQENKEKLILESVQGLYKSPIYQKTAKGIDPQEVLEVVKKSPELLIEILKKGK
ncbi:MAG: hypothetical protein H6581_24225 [Bacteroidia bacterium]|nr:hypothetical protein [Bacteroidia bacterium]